MLWSFFFFVMEAKIKERGSHFFVFSRKKVFFCLFFLMSVGECVCVLDSVRREIFFSLLFRGREG
jgi:hypothetical protein